MRAGRDRGRRRAFALLALCLLPAAACGARWSDEQASDVLSRYEDGGGSNGGGTGGSSVAGGGTSTGGGTGSTGAGTGAATGGGTGSTGGGTGTAAGAGAGTGGGATDAGTGEGGAVGAGGPAPCSASSDAPGVTADTITIGTISTLSGAVPGLGTSSLEAVRSYVAYRNATGGVCGRQLAFVSVDDGMDNARHRAAVNDLNSRVIGLAGGIGGGDAGSADTVVQLGMPVVSAPISEQFLNSAAVFPLNPPFANLNEPIAKFEHMYAQGARTAAIVYLAVDQTRSEINRQRPQMEAAGIQVVHVQELPLSTLSFDSAARAVANSGADYLLFVSDAGASASMARAMDAAGYQPKFEEYIVAYGSAFPELAGAAAEGSSTWIRMLPTEDGGSTPEQAAFIEWMDRTAPGVVKDQFAGEGWASAKALVDAIAALPGPITREAIMAQLSSTGAYDAGGLIGTIDLGARRNMGCQILMTYQGGAWRRIAPAQGFLC